MPYTTETRPTPTRLHTYGACSRNPRSLYWLANHLPTYASWLIENVEAMMHCRTPAFVAYVLNMKALRRQPIMSRYEIEQRIVADVSYFETERWARVHTVIGRARKGEEP